MAKRQRLVKDQIDADEAESTGHCVDFAKPAHVDVSLDDIKITALPEKSAAIQICTGEVKLS